MRPEKQNPAVAQSDDDDSAFEPRPLPPAPVHEPQAAWASLVQPLSQLQHTTQRQQQDRGQQDNLGINSQSSFQHQTSHTMYLSGAGLAAENGAQPAMTNLLKQGRPAAFLERDQRRVELSWTEVKDCWQAPVLAPSHLAHSPQQSQPAHFPSQQQQELQVQRNLQPQIQSNAQTQQSIAQSVPSPPIISLPNQHQPGSEAQHHLKKFANVSIDLLPVEHPNTWQLQHQQQEQKPKQIPLHPLPATVVAPPVAPVTLGGPLCIDGPLQGSLPNSIFKGQSVSILPAPPFQPNYKATHNSFLSQGSSDIPAHPCPLNQFSPFLSSRQQQHDALMTQQQSFEISQHTQPFSEIPSEVLQYPLWTHEAVALAFQSQCEQAGEGEAMPDKPAKQKRSRNKDLPKRPLSAYNLFFRDERARMIEEAARRNKEDSAADDHVVTVTKKDKAAMALGGRATPDDNKIGFQDLVQSVSKKWMTLDAKAKSHYQSLAREEKKKYVKEKEAVLAKQKETGPTSKRVKAAPPALPPPPPPAAHVLSSEKEGKRSAKKAKQNPN